MVSRNSRAWAGRVLAAALSAGISSLGAAPSVWAQAQHNQPASPVPAKPSAAQPQGPPVTDTTTYPFQQALDMLNGKQDAGPVVPSVSAAKAQVGAARVSTQTASAGPGNAAHAQVAHMNVVPPPAAPLSSSAEKALMIADASKYDSAMPEASKDGRVMYVFGAGLPTVIASPMHISIVELEPGETLTSEPAIGDSIRWELMPGSSGKGAMAQPLIMLKPHMPGLDTNLVITTDRRTYYLRLVSRDQEYMARTAFSYHEDEEAKWAKFVADERDAKVARENAQVVTPVANDAIDKLNFGYDIKGGNAVIRPVRVMDDGQKTYITMPDAVLHQDLPALVVLNPRLKGQKAEEIVNYRVKGNLYIVDRLFDRAALVIGSGKAVDKVVIQRKAPLAAAGGM